MVRRRCANNDASTNGENDSDENELEWHNGATGESPLDDDERSNDQNSSENKILKQTNKNEHSVIEKLFGSSSLRQFFALVILGLLFVGFVFYLSFRFYLKQCRST